MNNTATGNSLLATFASGKYYLVLFILWPFMAFLTALANYSQQEARRTVYFFLIYYGLTFINNNEAVDAFRYAMNLKANAALPFSDFFKIVGGLYSSDTSVDIVEPLISFIVSRFTSHHSIYFAVWAAIFGFFYLKSINLLHDNYHRNPGWNAGILMVFFIMILPITSISGVRMWTAAWIFFYGAYHVVLNRDPKFLLITLVAAFVHWSYISANVILIIYFVAGNRNFFYFPILLISFVLPRFIAPFLQTISLSLGGGLQNRFRNYTSEEYLLALQESGEQTVWFMKIAGNLLFYYLIFALLFIKLRYGSLMKSKKEQNLFSFILLFLSFVNFGMPIPSFGERYQILFFMFTALYIFLCYVKLPPNKIYLPVLVGLFPMLLFSIITFRLGSESINAWIFSPLFGGPIIAPVLSLADLLFH